MTSCYNKIKAIGRQTGEGRQPPVNIIRFMRRKTDSAFLYDYKTVAQALRFMRSHGYREIPVVSRDGVYRGVVDEGDFLWYLLDYGGYEAVKDHTLDALVRKGKCPALKITASDEQLKQAALRSAFVPIVDDRSAFVGVVDRQDVLRYFVDLARQEQAAGGETSC